MLKANLPLSPAPKIGEEVPPPSAGPVCKTFYADPELRMRTRATELIKTGLKIG